VQNRTYDDANQVNGWAYDAAGNLLDDGSTINTWDALNRLTVQGTTTNAYNGDGVLVAQTTGSGTISYTQDLASPLSQILGDGTNQYVYGADRLFGVASSTRTWYLGDALGSVRQTVDDTGVVQQTQRYDAWGVPQGAAIAPFGYTGELQQGNQVYLRARWYHVGNGAFSSRDPFAGMAEQPYSLHSYQYAYSNPILWADPTGRTPTKEGVEKGEFDYSCNCGWIDWGHATPEYVADRVFAAVGDAVNHFADLANVDCQSYMIGASEIDHPTGKFGITVSTTKFGVLIPRGKVNNTNQAQVAMGIFRWVEENIENVQLASKVLGDDGNSYFTEEDLASDLIAFYGSLNGKKALPNPEAYKAWVGQFCKFPEDAVSRKKWSLEVYNAYKASGGFTENKWWENPILRNHQCIDDYCKQFGSRSWPTKFRSIQPLPGGRATVFPDGAHVHPGSEDKTWLVAPTAYRGSAGQNPAHNLGIPGRKNPR